MKRLLLFILLGLGYVSQSQTVSEITRILNTVPQSITTAAGGSLNADLFSIDLSTSGYRLIGITVTGTWVGTITFQGSNDNFTTVTSIQSYQPNLNTGWQTTTTVNGSFNIPTQGFRYIRVRVTAYTSGSAASTAFGYLNGTDNGNISGSISILGTVPVSGAFFQGTQPVSIAAVLPVSQSGTWTVQPGNTPNTTAWKVDGSAVTQPVSGTFWQGTQPVSIAGNQSVNVAQINGITTLMGNGVTGTGSLRVTIASDNTAFAVNSNLQAGSNLVGKVGIDQTTVGTTNGVSIAQLGANTIAQGNGTAGNGVLRVAVASDQTAYSVNATDNLNQVNGTALLAGNGVTGTGSPRVTIASDNTAFNVLATPVQRKTYRASTAVVLVPAVTASVPFFCIYGSATKTIRVQNIILEGLTLTAVQYLNIGVAKYSTAPSGGTSTALTQIPLDANDPAGTATNVLAYTAVPTTGTRIGFVSAKRILGQATTAVAAGLTPELYFEWSNGRDGTSVILRGTAQGIGLEWIATVPASTVSMLVTVEWTEE